MTRSKIWMLHCDHIHARLIPLLQQGLILYVRPFSLDRCLRCSFAFKVIARIVSECLPTVHTRSLTLRKSSLCPVKIPEVGMAAIIKKGKVYCLLKT